MTLRRRLRTRSIVLLCVCADWRTCHRTVVAALLQPALGFDGVTHRTREDVGGLAQVIADARNVVDPPAR